MAFHGGIGGRADVVVGGTGGVTIDPTFQMVFFDEGFHDSLGGGGSADVAEAYEQNPGWVPFHGDPL